MQAHRGVGGLPIDTLETGIYPKEHDLLVKQNLAIKFSIK